VGNPEAGEEATAAILEAAARIDADALALACPLCEFNLEHHQKRLLAGKRLASPMPVIYFTQLMAYSFGLVSEENGFDIHPFALKLLS
jgi:heterodisulfide reductase subunit B